MKRWGSASGDSKEGGSAFTLKRAGVYPCLDTLYPGKFRAHCTRCSSDIHAGNFTRKRATFFYGFSEQEGVERLFRIAYKHADEMVKALARGKLKPGQEFTVRGDEIIPGRNILEPGEEIPDSDDSIPAVAMAMVNSAYTFLEDDNPVYFLQGERIAPYLIVYHDSEMPHANDIEAFDCGYAEDVLFEMDKQFLEKVDSKSKK